MLRLRKLRKQKGMTQSELAKIADVSTSSIGMYEQGRRLPELLTLKKIASFFNVSIDYLLGNDTTMPTNDLNRFLLQENVIFDDVVINLNDEDRKLLHQALEIAFKAIKH